MTRMDPSNPPMAPRPPSALPKPKPKPGVPVKPRPRSPAGMEIVGVDVSWVGQKDPAS